MAGAAIYTAMVIKHTADIATAEFALARRPAVFVTDLQAQIEPNFAGNAGTLILMGVLREVREIPTTVHEVRVRHYSFWKPSEPIRWHTNNWRDVPLYGEELTRPMVFTGVDVEEEMFNRLKNGEIDMSNPFSLNFVIEYTLSIQDGPREKWRVHTSVSCTEIGNCVADQPYMPQIELL